MPKFIIFIFPSYKNEQSHRQSDGQSGYRVVSLLWNFGSSADHGKMFQVTIMYKILTIWEAASCQTAKRTC